MIAIRTVEGTEQIQKEEIQEVLPYQSVFASPQLRKEFSAVVSIRGKLVPVVGKLPKAFDPQTKNYDERPWLLLHKEGYARVILGLPEFPKTLAQESHKPAISAPEKEDELEALLRNAG